MKGMRVLLVLLSTCLMVGQVISRSYSYSGSSGGTSIAGDIRIQTLNNGSMYCDSMICPQGTNSCRVTKRNDPNNFQVIIRNRKCFNINGDVLEEQSVNEPNTSNQNVNVQVVNGGGFQSIQGETNRKMTPEEQRELEENLRQTQERIQKEIDDEMNRLQQDLAPFLDGSFAQNLNRQIQSNIRNSFF